MYSTDPTPTEMLVELRRLHLPRYQHRLPAAEQDGAPSHATAVPPPQTARQIGHADVERAAAGYVGTRARKLAHMATVQLMQLLPSEGALNRMVDAREQEPPQHSFENVRDVLRHLALHRRLLHLPDTYSDYVDPAMRQVNRVVDMLPSCPHTGPDEHEEQQLRELLAQFSTPAVMCDIDEDLPHDVATWCEKQDISDKHRRARVGSAVMLTAS